MRDIGAIAVVHDGQAALSHIRSHPPRVVLLDLRMPGMGGMEVLEKVKETHPEVQVIICTGHGSQREEQRARELGAYEYLQKPVNLERLAVILTQARDAGCAG